MVYTAEKLASIFGYTVPDLMAINREILKATKPQVSPIWRGRSKRVLWKRHKKAEEGYDRVAEKWKKANDALGQSLEEEGILRELEWEAYQKACKEENKCQSRAYYGKERYPPLWLTIINYLRIENTSGRECVR
ncbi:unnamed protein product [Rhizophagus irregularis]|nr:unnamed protein product [Rhizophagus irregularis]